VPSPRKRRARPGRVIVLAAVATALLAGGVIAVLSRSSGTGHRQGTLATRSTTSPASPAAGHGSPVAPAVHGHHRHLHHVDPGTLPQTHAVPSTGSQHFVRLAHAVWEGVVRDSLDTALPAFFPRAAYVQVKAIPSAALDWSGRLLHDFRLDLSAAHSLLGARPERARLLGLDAPSPNAHWVPPNVCDNRVGYYELANARVVYREDGETRSFGVASLISWRGVWYVVHLGAIVRSGGSGIVDEPLAGAGASRPSTSC